MKDHFKRQWKNYLTLIFFVLFVTLLFFFYTNLELLKTNPCKLCIDHYDLTCTDGKGLVLNKGFDWDGSERLEDLQQEMNAQYAELYESLNEIDLKKSIGES